MLNYQRVQYPTQNGCSGGQNTDPGHHQALPSSGETPRWLWDSPCPKPTMTGDGFPSNHENGDDLGMVSFCLGFTTHKCHNVDVNSR